MLPSTPSNMIAELWSMQKDFFFFTVHDYALRLCPDSFEQLQGLVWTSSEHFQSHHLQHLPNYPRVVTWLYLPEGGFDNPPNQSINWGHGSKMSWSQAQLHGADMQSAGEGNTPARIQWPGATLWVKLCPAITWQPLQTITTRWK